MPINPLKEFFKRRKAEVKFATAGPGKTLASSEIAKNQPGPTNEQHSSARQAAAEAAMKRFNQSNAGRPAQRPKISSQSGGSSTSGALNKQLPASSETSTHDNNTHATLQELLVVDGQVQRNEQIYSTDELTRRIKQPEIDNDFFRLTVEDAKLFKLRYDEERARNEILKTSEMRRREAEAKKPTKNFARLRFKLPNNMVIEASFMANETMASIRDWIVAVALEKTNFNLNSYDVLMGLRPLKEADFEKTVKELGLIPATTLTIVQKSNSWNWTAIVVVYYHMIDL